MRTLRGTPRTRVGFYRSSADEFAGQRAGVFAVGEDRYAALMMFVPFYPLHQTLAAGWRSKMASPVQRELVEVDHVHVREFSFGQ